MTELGMPRRRCAAGLRRRAAALAVLLLSLLALGMTGAAAQPDVGLRHACPSERITGHTFTDVTPGMTHETAVRCVVSWGILEPDGETTFNPAGTIVHSDIGPLFVRLLQASGGELPEGTEGDPAAVAAALTRHDRRMFLGDEPVTRDHMASYLVAAYEYRTDSRLPAGEDRFRDDEGSQFEADINKAAEAGFVAGLSPGIYRSGVPARRDQLATSLARIMDRFIAEGVASASGAAVDPAAGQAAPQPAGAAVDDAGRPLWILLGAAGAFAAVAGGLVFVAFRLDETRSRRGRRSVVTIVSQALTSWHLRRRSTP